MTEHGCEMRGCKAPPRDRPRGRLCDPHARVMTPRSQWAAEGVPYPEGQEPPPPPRIPQITRPVPTRIGGLDVIYAPCPKDCGRPTCYLPGQDMPPCAGCESGAAPSPEPEAKPASPRQNQNRNPPSLTLS